MWLLCLIPRQPSGMPIVERTSIGFPPPKRSEARLRLQLVPETEGQARVR
jgi:hypothetical protein